MGPMVGRSMQITGHAVDIIILAMIAGFVALRLYSVLGRHSGNEQLPEKPFDFRDLMSDSSDDPKTAQPGAGADIIDLHPDPAMTKMLSAVMVADRQFDPQGFANGARGAYEMIIEAFAAGDRDTLEPLLGDDVREGFISAIDAREAAGQTMETKVVDILDANIIDASVENKVAEVTVRFRAEIISVLHDSEGRIIDGNPSDVDEIVDVWTFARDTKSRDPNWPLVATEREE
jgi:predicted lipid-binding transport protein (Tim44 family)